VVEVVVEQEMEMEEVHLLLHRRRMTLMNIFIVTTTMRISIIMDIMSTSMSIIMDITTMDITTRSFMSTGSTREGCIMTLAVITIIITIIIMTMRTNTIITIITTNWSK